jgi:formylmethanofuran--tetrahydromethanopterin N-formyltransferase
MQINGVRIDDAASEAYDLVGTRVIITADSPELACAAAMNFTGYATAVAACECEAGIEGPALNTTTPDGRPGVAVLFFASTQENLEAQLVARIQQSVMSCPTSACYSGLASETQIAVGTGLRLFGDGWQSDIVLEGKRYWRIPVMDGEFVVEAAFGCAAGVGGANFVIFGEALDAVLAAGHDAVEAVAGVPGVILPYPSGMLRSGFRLGSRYKSAPVSTYAPLCPTLRGRSESSLPDGVHAAVQVVVSGLGIDCVGDALRAGIRAACRRRDGVAGITAASHGGKVGPHKVELHEVLQLPGDSDTLSEEEF